MDIFRLLEYDIWATRQLLGATTSLTDEQFTKEVAGDLGSVHQQSVHLVTVPDRYRARLVGEPVPDPALSDFKSPADVIAYHEGVAIRMRAMAASIPPERLGEEIRHQTRRGLYILTVEQTLLQVVNHGTYHRGQIACLLKYHGVEPIDTDIILWPEI